MKDEDQHHPLDRDFFIAHCAVQARYQMSLRNRMKDDNVDFLDLIVEIGCKYELTFEEIDDALDRSLFDLLGL